ARRKGGGEDGRHVAGRRKRLGQRAEAGGAGDADARLAVGAGSAGGVGGARAGRLVRAGDRGGGGEEDECAHQKRERLDLLSSSARIAQQVMAAAARTPLVTKRAFAQVVYLSTLL